MPEPGTAVCAAGCGEPVDLQRDANWVAGNLTYHLECIRREIRLTPRTLHFHKGVEHAHSGGRKEHAHEGVTEYWRP